MTLNLTIISTWGIWQSSDHRLVDTATSMPLDNFSVKHVLLRCPDGSALLAYAGAGRVGDVDLSNWIREMLRGESRTLDQSFILIRENATRDLAPLLRGQNIYHMFSIGAFLTERPWAIQIRNFNVTSGRPDAIVDHFDTVAKQIDGPGQGFIFGDFNAVTRQDHDKLMVAATRKPRRPRDFRNLLASINRRAAETPSGKKTVTPHCVTTYVAPKGEPFESEFHDAAGAPAPPVVPTLLFGIDTTDIQRALLDSQDHGGASLQHEVERAGKESVVPKNRLRR